MNIQNLLNQFMGTTNSAPVIGNAVQGISGTLNKLAQALELPQSLITQIQWQANQALTEAA